MNTAHITSLDLAPDGVLLVKATCQRCRKTVLHGAGDNLDALILGHRIAHCGCGAYELVDFAGLVPARVSVLRAEHAEKVARQACRAARTAPVVARLRADFQRSQRKSRGAEHGGSASTTSRLQQVTPTHGASAARAHLADALDALDALSRGPRRPTLRKEPP